MTREEIRGWAFVMIRPLCISDEHAEAYVKDFFRGLSKRGVVIKVDREHNVHDNSGCACETCSIVRAVKAGYSAWEPLMEEKE